jgi:modulator of FtsH protease HflK
MEQNFNRTGLINWLALIIAALGAEAFSQIAVSTMGEITAANLLIGALVALVAWFQMRLATREDAERLEMEDLARRRASASLFAESAEDSFPARRSRIAFERWILPTFTILLFAAQAVATYWFIQRYREWPLPRLEPSTLASASYAGLGLVLLLLGLYAAKLSRYASIRLLRPSAAHLVLGGLFCFATAGTEIAVYAGYPQWDKHVALAGIAIFGLVALETLLALVFEAYRPRVKGREERLIYESRLVGILGQPTGLFSTAAQALDYQFGFKVSETWFYRFLEKAIAWIVLAQAGALLLSTSIVVIDPGEQGLHERFGNPVGTLDSGLHFKLPWPIDSVERINTRAIQSFNVGFVPDPNLDKENTVLWTRSHYKTEFNLLVASREQSTNATDEDQTVPANFLTVSIPVQFIVTNAAHWGYNHAQPARLLEQIANREVVRYLASVDVDSIMSSGRAEAARELRNRIQSASTAAGLGTEIIFIGLQDIHPPIGNKEVKVAAAYEQVIGAEQEKEARILEAEGYANETLPAAKALAARTVNQAKADTAVYVNDAAGRAARFGHQVDSFRKAPDVYTARNYLETLRTALVNTRKYVIMPTNTHDVVTIDLTEKIRRDVLDIQLDPVKGKDEKK